MPLVDFENPPVVETVLSVEFAPLRRWAVPHFGLFWNEIRTEFPIIDVHPPLQSQVEHFEEVPIPLRLRFLPGPPPVRCWFTEASGDRLLQIQHDRFIHNWRKQPGQSYGHYDESIRPSFEREWSRFCSFTEREGLGRPEACQCEVTYINILEAGKGWTTPADLGQVFPLWRGERSGTFLPAEEAVSFNTSYVMPDSRGRLHVTAEPGFQPALNQQVIQLTLTARGSPTGSSLEELLAWFDLGREWVVRGFLDVTSETMHKAWGIK
jgi:uncharacterized protein (TIGR04255 family)